MSNFSKPTHTPADAVSDNWVDKTAPEFAKPYLRLMRADRPVGVWLLLFPCWHGLALAIAESNKLTITHLWYALLFAIGAYVMRSAGCTYNDIIDRDIDGQVERTANRPLPSGQITTKQAWLFLSALCFTGLIVLLQFNLYTIILGISSLALVAVYPFAKRITWWPQAWLGLTFNWGALVGYTAVTGYLSPAAIFLYGGGIAWTLGYDTIYAHQDREDDALIGVKSSARRLGTKTKPALYVFYGLVIAAYGAALVAAGLSFWFAFALIPAAIHLFRQAIKLDINDGSLCLRLFQSNRDTGFILLAPMLLAILVNYAHV